MCVLMLLFVFLWRALCLAITLFVIPYGLLRVEEEFCETGGPTEVVWLERIMEVGIAADKWRELSGVYEDDKMSESEHEA